MRETLPAFMPKLLAYEGGYVDHPRDPGGATNLGVTIGTLREWRGQSVTKADVRALTREEAERIYKAMYWDKIGADNMLAGVDAALFDVAVNSGVGRARQWKPLTMGREAVKATKAVCARRRAFFRNLRTFDTFGRGWMRRVNDVEAWCIAWAVKRRGGDVSAALEQEAKASDRTVKQAGTGAVVTTTPAAASGGVEWMPLLIVGVPLLVALTWLIYVAVTNADRARAMREVGDV